MMQNIIALSYFAAWRILRWLPERFVYSSADRVADHMVRKNGKFTIRFRSNLQRTQPNITPLDLDLLVYKATRSAFRYWCDTFRFPDWSKERILTTVTFNDESILMDAVAAGNGAIVTLPHCGNYDHAAAYFCADERSPGICCQYGKVRPCGKCQGAGRCATRSDRCGMDWKRRLL